MRRKRASAACSRRSALVLFVLCGCGPTVPVNDEEGSATDGPLPSSSSSFTGDPDASSFGDEGSSDPSTTGGTPDTDTDTSGTLEPSPHIGSGDRFVDAFFHADGLVIVHAGGALVLSREGEMLRSYESERVVESAAFDGERLVLADQAELSVLDQNLAVSISAALVEGCASSVLVGGGRFICGPANDWDRVFYTYDVSDGSLLGTSDPYTYNGVPMRQVPGLDEFISVTHDLSPSDFHLYGLTKDSRAIYINESPYHGDFAVQLQYAFWGDPATHVVTSGGLLLRIHDAGCEPGSVFESGCFVKDGELGTLPLDLWGYVDVREGDANTVYALAADSADTYYFDPICGQPSCTIQRIDVTRRTVVDSVTFVSPRTYVFLRPDTYAAGLALIAADSAPFQYPGEDGDGFDVHYLPN